MEQGAEDIDAVLREALLDGALVVDDAVAAVPDGLDGAVDGGLVIVALTVEQEAAALPDAAQLAVILRLFPGRVAVQQLEDDAAELPLVLDARVVREVHHALLAASPALPPGRLVHLDGQLRADEVFLVRDRDPVRDHHFLVRPAHQDEAEVDQLYLDNRSEQRRSS